ncbi:inositol monophosphatase family protein [Paenibacillus rigui]|uniref:Inositol monophosphatase n=1 Tax=Paenibacillus rigui TaxID=554312 RepID=A0A229UYL3_9BACL|nr:inositol monophosphatase family protein [Paenibacillus rigui]OXM88205.1 inositol monophosphatase [Paenibacillus rigui]
MMETLEMAEKIAVDAARAAGDAARKLFRHGFAVQEKDASGDLLTEADLAAEEAILSRIRSTFPDHQIRSEESGWSGVEGDWLWLVDPLDGTNNFAIGLPVFGVSITLIYRQEPVLGVIYDTIQDDMYVARKGGGATCNGEPLHMRPKPASSKLTLGWIQGHQVQNDPPAVRLRRHIEAASKRMLRLWAPTMQWALLARGNLDGIVLYNSEGDDLYSGLLLVQEAGGLVLQFDGTPFTGMHSEPYIIACPPDRKERLMCLVNEGLESSGKEQV